MLAGPDDKYRCKIGDVGLAILASRSATAPGGSEFYRAPEVPQEHATQASDIYSVGMVCLLHLLKASLCKWNGYACLAAFKDGSLAWPSDWLAFETTSGHVHLLLLDGHFSV